MEVWMDNKNQDFDKSLFQKCSTFQQQINEAQTKIMKAHWEVETAYETGITDHMSTSRMSQQKCSKITRLNMLHISSYPKPHPNGRAVIQQCNQNMFLPQVQMITDDLSHKSMTAEMKSNRNSLSVHTLSGKNKTTASADQTWYHNICHHDNQYEPRARWHAMLKFCQHLLLSSQSIQDRPATPTFATSLLMVLPFIRHKLLKQCNGLHFTPKTDQIDKPSNNVTKLKTATVTHASNIDTSQSMLISAPNY